MVPDAVMGELNTALVRSTVGLRRQCSTPSFVAMTMVPAASAGAGERPSGGELPVMWEEMRMKPL